VKLFLLPSSSVAVHRDFRVVTLDVHLDPTLFPILSPVKYYGPCLAHLSVQILSPIRESDI
jgi:hypothetical protein